jgi:Redoxin
MNKLAQKIELASHIAIVIVAALISIVLVKNYLLPDSKTKSGTNNTAIASNTIEDGMVGKAISLPGTDWKRSDQTIVLVLSTGCHFCTESAPFYKELVQKRKQGNTCLIAILPQPVDSGRKYLSDLGIAVDDVKQAQPSSLGVRGTPTLLLVNKDGVVTSSWRGKLSQDKELEIMARL